MLTFLRKICQESLIENKFCKNMIYDIEKNFIVDAKILIALPINNWNETITGKTMAIIKSILSFIPNTFSE